MEPAFPSPSTDKTGGLPFNTLGQSPYVNSSILRIIVTVVSSSLFFLLGSGIILPFVMLYNGMVGAETLYELSHPLMEPLQIGLSIFVMIIGAKWVWLKTAPGESDSESN